MSSEYEAACEVRDAIQALDDKDRALARIADSLERIAKSLEVIAAGGVDMATVAAAMQRQQS